MLPALKLCRAYLRFACQGPGRDVRLRKSDGVCREGLSEEAPRPRVGHKPALSERTLPRQCAQSKMLAGFQGPALRQRRGEGRPGRGLTSLCRGAELGQFEDSRCGVVGL